MKYTLEISPSANKSFHLSFESNEIEDIYSWIKTLDVPERLEVTLDIDFDNAKASYTHAFVSNDLLIEHIKEIVQISEERYVNQEPTQIPYTMKGTCDICGKDQEADYARGDRWNCNCDN